MIFILVYVSSAEMNRHHYSLYVHNCRLVLLLRQEPTESENYKPAEFHWKLDQVSQLEPLQKHSVLKDGLVLCLAR